jgi:nicotinate-nucleotide pyrophosphorylase (carboxylating)
MNPVEIEYLDEFLKMAILEDIGSGDHTTLATISKTQNGIAKLIVKEEGIIAGIATSLTVFNTIDRELEVDYYVQDGDLVMVGDVAFEVKGKLHSILAAERLVLNIMQRMSGIATMTRKVVDSISTTKAKVLDTRKTTPGLRYLEKQAVRIGKGVNHRMGLFDMILIKDNHIDYAGGIGNALDKAFKYRRDNGLDIDIEIEVRNLEELNEVLASDKVDRVLLDNFDYQMLKDAVKLVNGRIITEASGGITLENALEFASCGVDYISMGALTHSVKSLDMSLKAKGLASNL